MLTLDHVHFYYDKAQTIIDDLSLTINDGEFVAVIGGNGCGKSTLARLMNGLLQTRKGRVKLDHLDTANVKDVAEIHRQIGLVFQNPDDQFITTTVMDEVLFGLENIRVSRDEMTIRLDDALRAVQMEDYTDAMPHELSGGQKQRVAIAAILAMRPRIMIFDEATSMLDPQGREQLLSIMYELHRQGMTIIHITHHLEEVLTADRLLLLHEGRLEFDGHPLTFFNTVCLKDYGMDSPFAVRLHRALQLSLPLMADWKEMITSQWSTR
ncbi:energy-coupling factor transporter ATPase [Paenibacillus sp. D2_2]|uniref:energy-coupling factor transporter ATPase n=1 Tax=Paenibacillus sp. D2_2 TaxID=3073092 RepID=UPI002815B0E2|nr:energy-coupling factor transporter ATPase [Paenibacillus sp. D2_2]WMT43120.1 energy-coupling factor transporter ATPase [Paenibacillus sp. D2_2]